MEFAYSRHALDEMQQRGINRAVVDDVLQEPDQIVESEHTKRIYQSKKRMGRGKLFLVRVVVAFDVDPPLVVTVYRTSKIEKYWSDQ